jgi:hypothetical protein
MKTLLTEKFLIAFATLFLLQAENGLKAQFVVYDPAQFGNMIKSLANEIKLIANTAKTLQETKNILQTAIRTKEEIENIYSLQWEVQYALGIARGIKDLKWSDLDFVSQKALGISIDPNVYIPNIPETYTLRQTLGREPTTKNARQLYSLLVGINSYSEPINNFADFQIRSKEAAINQFALVEMTGQKRLQTAMSYNELADEMIAQANELIIAVKRDRKLTMNEAERLSTLKQCQEVLMQSLDLKRQADEMMLSVIESKSASNDTFIQTHQNQLVRQALAETPQMKYGK